MPCAFIISLRDLVVRTFDFQYPEKGGSDANPLSAAIGITIYYVFEGL